MLLVALGAALGAPVRLLAGLALDREVPWGTLAVNLVGSGLLGWLVGHGIDGHPMALLGTGFCGAVTTYSAVVVHAVNDGGRRGGGYAVATVLGSLACAAAGFALG